MCLYRGRARVAAQALVVNVMVVASISTWWNDFFLIFIFFDTITKHGVMFRHSTFNILKVLRKVEKEVS